MSNSLCIYTLLCSGNTHFYLKWERRMHDWWIIIFFFLCCINQFFYLCLSGKWVCKGDEDDRCNKVPRIIPIDMNIRIRCRTNCIILRNWLWTWYCSYSKTPAKINLKWQRIIKISRLEYSVMLAINKLHVCGILVTVAYELEKR